MAQIKINTDRLTIPLGKTVLVKAVYTGQKDQTVILLPFVNQKRWGAHERPDSEGQATFIIPLPNPGRAEIQVAAVPVDSADWMGLQNANLLMAGHPWPTDPPEGFELSNTLAVQVQPRSFPRRPVSSSLFGMQWEPWFCWGIQGWRTAQAVPLTGFYDLYNRDVLRQHILWMMELGVDFIFPDWTNHIWGCQHWDERSDAVNAIVHVTTLFLEELACLSEQGLPVPKVVLFPGLSNGRPATMEALNEELNWIYHTYIRNPRFVGLWQEYEGKPLMVVLDTGAVGDQRGTAEAAFRIPFFKQTLELNEAELDAFRAAQGPVDDRFTVRWMSSQNDTTRHHELGYWSWMDGSIEPPVTFYQGQAEAVTVAVGFFGAQGWKHPTARGRRGGATLVETFQTALENRPRFIFLHQFNEFTGQPEGHGYGPEKSIFVDTYNVELSDDFEPVSLTAPGCRGDQGGWGFFYLNLARALLDIYRGTAEDSTVLAVSSPLAGARLTKEDLQITWATLGAPVTSFTLEIDDRIVRTGLTSSPAQISLADLAAGAHKLTLTAVGATICFPLSNTEVDVPLAQPMPVKVTVPFSIG